MNPKSALRSLERLLYALYIRSARHPKMALAVGLFLFLLSALQLPQTRFAVSVEDFLEPQNPSALRWSQTRTKFDLGPTLLLSIAPKHNSQWTQLEFCSARRALEAIKAQHQNVASLFSVFDVVVPLEDTKRSTLDYLPLNSFPCDLSSWQSTRERELQALESAKNELSGSHPFSQTRWQILRPFHDLLASPEGRHLLAHVSLRDAKGRAKMGPFDPADVFLLESLVHLHLSDFNVTISGAARQQQQVLNGLHADTFLNAIAAFLLLGACYFFYRSWRVGVLLLSTLIFSAVITFATMVDLGWPVDMLSNGLFTLLAVATVQDFLFLCNGMRGRPVGSSHLVFARFLTPCFLTSLTTIVGFGSLAFAGPPLLARFGLMAAWAVFVEWCVVFLLLPSLIKLFPKLWRLPEARMNWHLSFNRWFPRRSLVLFTLVMFASLALLPKLTSGDDPLRAFPRGHPQSVSTQTVKETHGFVSELSLVFQKSVSTEQKNALVQKLRLEPSVHVVLEPSAFLDWMQSKLTEPATVVLERDVKAAHFFSTFFSEGHTRAVLLIRNTHTKDIQRIQTIVNSVCRPQDCFLSGEVAVYAQFANDVNSALLSGLALSIGLIATLLVILAKGLGQAQWKRVVWASLWGPSVNVALLPLLGLEVNFVTSVFASVVVSIAGDNAIHFWFAARKRGTDWGVLHRSAGSFDMTAFMIPLSLVLCFSTFGPPKVLGVLLAVSFVCMTFGDVFYLRGLLHWKPFTFQRP
jgi:predicted RND superfamily exporter protein